MGQEHAEAFKAISPRIETILRKDRDEVVRERLVKYPNLWKWRDQHPFMLKILDVVIMSEGPDLHFLDSDVFFFSETRGLFPESTPAVFCHDDGQGYSAPLLTLKKRYGRRLLSGCNAGMLKFPKARYDLDLMEDFVSRPENLVQYALVEQTMFCLLQGAGETWQTRGEDIHCSFRTTEFPSSILGVHLIYNMKAEWKKHLAYRPARQGGTVQLRRVPELTYSKIGLRKLRRMLGQS